MILNFVGGFFLINETKKLINDSRQFSTTINH